MSNNIEIKRLRILNAISFFVMIIVNFLANYLPINGQTTGEVSKKYPNLFTPAPYTFSIWILIYLLLFGFVIYQFFKRDASTESFIKKVNWYFIISSIANALWIVAWHYEKIGLSLILMVVILWSLINIYNNIKDIVFITPLEKIFLKIPFCIYLAWISVATIANVTVFLKSVNWNGFGVPETVWFIIVVVLAFILGIFSITKNNDFFFALTILWALIGIIVARISIQATDVFYLPVMLQKIVFFSCKL